MLIRVFLLVAVSDGRKPKRRFFFFFSMSSFGISKALMGDMIARD